MAAVFDRGKFDVSVADNYTLLRNISNDFPTAAELVSGLTTNAYEDATTSVGQNYYYWVKAGNTGGFSAITGPAQGFTSTPQPATLSNIYRHNLFGWIL